MTWDILWFMTHSGRKERAALALPNYWSGAKWKNESQSLHSETSVLPITDLVNDPATDLRSYNTHVHVCGPWNIDGYVIRQSDVDVSAFSPLELYCFTGTSPLMSQLSTERQNPLVFWGHLINTFVHSRSYVLGFRKVLFPCNVPSS